MSKTKKRAIAIVLAAVLLISAVVGGTVAYLTSYPTSAVVNTFTVGKVDIDLKEHNLATNGSLGSNEVTENTYNFMPGDKLNKDPFVKVLPGSEACWLFVKAYESNNVITVDKSQVKIITFNIDDTQEGELQWKQYNGTTDTWYCKVPANTSDAAVLYNIIKGRQISISDKITSDHINAMTGDNTPKLSFKAAAVQSANVNDVTSAYNEIQAELNTTPTT